MLVWSLFAGCSNNTYNGHEFVDLGLPSGTLWATCNVGAGVPEDYGDYFAWGETEPKEIYDCSTYKYCVCNKGQSPKYTASIVDQLTKYCINSESGYNGYTDFFTTLQPSDDAATTNWGNGWCIPNVDQWKELFQNTSNKWTTKNGINGRLFIGRNGNNLFLPAAGVRDSDESYFVGSNGGYWSSSLCNEYEDEAWGFGFCIGWI